MKLLERSPWGISYAVPLTTDNRTTIVNDVGYWGHGTTVAWVSRFGSSDGTYTIDAIGKGFEFDSAVEAATEALLQRNGEERHEFTEESEPGYEFHVNGCPFEVDCDQEYMLVTITDN